VQCLAVVVSCSQWDWDSPVQGRGGTEVSILYQGQTAIGNGPEKWQLGLLPSLDIYLFRV
jgi:hypothetical protein